MNGIAVIIFMLVAPTAADIDVETRAFPLSLYGSMGECEQALQWIEEHQADLDRHIWCHANTGE